MARNPTERVTVRLNQQHMRFVDNLIEAGEYRNRTHAIAEALRDWVNKKSREVPQVMESQKGQMELQKVIATMAQLQAQIEKIQKK
jgi:Arc/MetJ-type ribon-helix-helix transcriptional regulator